MCHLQPASPVRRSRTEILKDPPGTPDTAAGITGICTRYLLVLSVELAHTPAQARAQPASKIWRRRQQVLSNRQYQQGPINTSTQGHWHSFIFQCRLLRSADDSIPIIIIAFLLNSRGCCCRSTGRSLMTIMLLIWRLKCRIAEYVRSWPVRSPRDQCDTDE